MSYLLKKTLEISKQQKILPDKSKGQNFLIDQSVYDIIIDSSELQASDIVLEVGPGLGFLTEKLSEKVKKVIAVELDERLVMFLRNKFKDHKNIEIIHKNILDLENEVKYSKIVANLPYNISSRFLKIFLSERKRPDSLVLMLQKELVDRICAKKGGMSILGISVQYFSTPKKIVDVSRACFWPEPRVESSVLRLVCDRESHVNYLKVLERDYFRLVKIAFSSKRKMLKNNLAAGYQIDTSEAVEIIEKAGFAKSVRAQELGVKDYLKLLGSF